MRTRLEADESGYDASPQSSRGRDQFRDFQPPLLALARACALLPQGTRRWLLKRARRVGGLVGIGIRYSLLVSMGSTSEPNVSIHEDVYLFNVDEIRLGRNVSVHPMCYLDGLGGIEIGNDVSIAHAVTIMSSNHRYDSLRLPIKDQGVYRAPTRIGDDCWIGSHAVIIGGISVGRGVVVAASSVVTKDVPDYVMVAGVPARVIKERGVEDGQ